MQIGEGIENMIMNRVLEKKNPKKHRSMPFYLGMG
jgi:hypothetical protein